MKITGQQKFIVYSMNARSRPIEAIQEATGLSQPDIQALLAKVGKA